MSRPTAVLETGDSLPLLAEQLMQWRGIFTSLPDAAELDLPVDVWRPWFETAVGYTIGALARDGYAIFYQTDRRHRGQLVSKAAVIFEVAPRFDCRVVWHKVAVRSRKTLLYRPAFTHLICVSSRGRSGRPTPDVFDCGRRDYPDGTDSASVDVALRFLYTQGVRRVADPFCGRGAIARAAARDYDMASWSVDVLGEQVEAAAEALEPYADVTVDGAPR